MAYGHFRVRLCYFVSQNNIILNEKFKSNEIPWAHFGTLGVFAATANLIQWRLMLANFLLTSNVLFLLLKVA